MRKVKFNRHIKSGNPQQLGTWESGFKNEGVFHQFIVCYDMPSAIIEMDDGTVEKVPLVAIKFI